MRRSTQDHLLAVASSMNVVAQVTTSSISGVVKTSKGEALAGAIKSGARINVLH